MNPHILDSWHLSYKPIHNASVSFKYTNNKYHKRCKAIKKELKKHNMVAKIHRHSLFRVEYIVITFDREANGYISTAQRKIAEALQIPLEWVGMVTCCDPQMYFIKEKEFMKQYPSANSGTIHFEEDNDEV